MRPTDFNFVWRRFVATRQIVVQCLFCAWTLCSAGEVFAGCTEVLLKSNYTQYPSDKCHSTNTKSALFVKRLIPSPVNDGSHWRMSHMV